MTKPRRLSAKKKGEEGFHEQRGGEGINTKWGFTSGLDWGSNENGETITNAIFLAQREKERGGL